MKWKGILICVLLLISVPLWVKNVYYLRIINMIGISVLLTLGLNLLIGFTGQISLGQAAFYAVGAYVSALLSTRIGIPFWVALPFAGIAGGLLGLLIGPVLRLRGFGLAMATFYLGEIVRIVLIQWKPLTGGANGIANIPYPHIGKWVLSTNRQFFYLILTLVIINYLVLTRLLASRIGRAMQAIRDNQEAAEVIGINAVRYKIIAFVLAGFFSGIAGSLYAHLTTFVSPESFDISKSVEILAMVVVGGTGSLWGSVIGVIIITVLPELLRALQEYRLILYGGMLLIILNFTSAGLASVLRNIFLHFPKGKASRWFF
jgi:branched-chain amino acid transport system permease protein